MSPSAGTCLLLYDVKAASCIPDRKCCKTVGAEIKQINAWFHVIVDIVNTYSIKCH